MDCRPPGSSVHGILQARILEWVSLSFSRGASPPRDQTSVSCIADALQPGKQRLGKDANNSTSLRVLLQSLNKIIYVSTVQHLAIERLNTCSITKSCLTLPPPGTAAHQASLSFTISQSLLKLMSIEPMMPSNHLILCHPLFLLPSIFPAPESFAMTRLFASGVQNIGASASASVLPVNIQGWFPLGWTGLISLQFKGLKGKVQWPHRRLSQTCNTC